MILMPVVVSLFITLLSRYRAIRIGDGAFCCRWVRTKLKQHLDGVLLRLRAATCVFEQTNPISQCFLYAQPVVMFVTAEIRSSGLRGAGCRGPEASVLSHKFVE